jgi:hypothetical protein
LRAVPIHHPGDKRTGRVIVMAHALAFAPPASEALNIKTIGMHRSA